MPNRSVPPPIAKLSAVSFPEHSMSMLGGKIPMIRLQSSNYEVVKIEFIFSTGRIYERQRLASKATHLLLKAGTSTMTSSEINEKIDFYGATIGLPINFDTGGVVLYCMSKYVQVLVPFVIDLITDASFPERELSFFLEQQQGKLQIALNKADNVAFRKITEQIFGQDHPYGYNTTEEDLNQLTREVLKDQHRRLYNADNCRIYISGNLREEDLEILEKEIRRIPAGQKAKASAIELAPSEPSQLHIPLENKVQVAIRIGRRTFKRSHPDFQKVYLFGVLLGGYFGSRLSMNIREEKGYTYGIHTTMDAMLLEGFFLISTEVAQEYKALTLQAIYDEIADLRTNLVSDEELNQMKSYLQGYLLSSVDGVFKSGAVLKGLKESGVDERYFETLQQTLETYSAKDIKAIANRYFNQSDLYEVVVG